MTEEAIDPERPIVDPHHHLWDLRPLAPTLEAIDHPFSTTALATPGYLLDGLLADVNASGHNVVKTVFVECSAFHRADGPEPMRVVGEVEFARGIAAQSASGAYGPMRACAGIVGHADLTLGDEAQPVLEAMIEAGGSRFKGIRHMGAFDADPNVLGPLAAISPTPPDLFGDPAFRQGFTHLCRLGLSFDAWVLEPQIPMVTELARTFPDARIVLDHAGTPIGIGTYAGSLGERFDVWRRSIKALAACPNVSVKIGGLAMPFTGLTPEGFEMRRSSSQLAELWRPYVEVCIEEFGANRSMFESNYPVDRWSSEYGTIWNAFKRIVDGAGSDEKDHLFMRTAERFYGV